MNDLEKLKKLEGKECEIRIICKDIYISSNSVNLHLKSNADINIKVSESLSCYLYRATIWHELRPIDGGSSTTNKKSWDYYHRPLHDAIQKNRYKCFGIREDLNLNKNGFILETLYGDLIAQVNHPNKIEVKELGQWQS